MGSVNAGGPAASAQLNDVSGLSVRSERVLAEVEKTIAWVGLSQRLLV